MYLQKYKIPKYFIKTKQENKETLVGVLWYNNSIYDDTPMTPPCREA